MRFAVTATALLLGGCAALDGAGPPAVAFPPAGLVDERLHVAADAIRAAVDAGDAVSREALVRAQTDVDGAQAMLLIPDRARPLPQRAALGISLLLCRAGIDRLATASCPGIAGDGALSTERDSEAAAKARRLLRLGCLAPLSLVGP